MTRVVCSTDDLTRGDGAAVPPALALEVALALEAHRLARIDAAKDARLNGRTAAPLPLGFVEIRDRFIAAARGCQDATSTPDWADLADAVYVTPRLFTITQTARALACSTRTTERLISAGRLPAVRVADNTVRVRAADLDVYVAALPTTRPAAEESVA